MLTNNKAFVILLIAIGVAVFLYPTQAMSRAGKSLTASSDSRPKVAFFIEDIMRTCKIEGCKNKYYGKGLCQKHYKEQYRQVHKKEIKKYGKQWHNNHKEYCAKRAKQWEECNKEKRKKSHQRWEEINKEHRTKQKKQYRQEHKIEITEFFKQYRQTPAGRANQKASRHNRRALTKGLTRAIVQRVYADNIKKYGVLTCYLCLKPIVNNNDSLDHSIPLIRQGTNKYENLGIAHLNCNIRKGIKTLEEWFAAF